MEMGRVGNHRPDGRTMIAPANASGSHLDGGLLAREQSEQPGEEAAALPA